MAGIRDATLTRVQQNEIVQLIVEHGPPLDQFQWTSSIYEEAPHRASVRSVAYQVSVLSHKPTGYYCIFGAHGIKVCPGADKKVQTTPHDDEWHNKVNVCGRWLVDLKGEVEAPDLFATLLSASQVHLDEAKGIAAKLNAEHINQQITRLERAAREDPELAIGTAKEFLETLCKTILDERNIGVKKDEDLPGLVKLTIRNLKVLPDGVTAFNIDKTVMALVGNLGATAHQLAQIRNAFGTGHGKPVGYVGLEERHAQLAVGAAVTLAVFLFRCHEAG
jgi:hypothetical protein